MEGGRRVGGLDPFLGSSFGIEATNDCSKLTCNATKGHSASPPGFKKLHGIVPKKSAQECHLTSPWHYSCKNKFGSIIINDHKTIAAGLLPTTIDAHQKEASHHNPTTAIRPTANALGPIVAILDAIAAILNPIAVVVDAVHNHCAQ